MSDQETQDPEVLETETPAPIDLDQTIKVGGEEYSIKDLADARAEVNSLRQQNEQLQSFRQSTMRLMDPDSDPESKKQDARLMLSEAGYDRSQIEEWVQVYDQEDNEMTEDNTAAAPETRDMEARQHASRMQEDINRMRAQSLKREMENTISSAVSGNEDAKVLLGWVESTRSSDELNVVKERISEQVRASALENLRRRRDAAGTFEDSWVTEEVAKAATKVSKDMLTVIGDTSKIGRVSETAEQTETLSQRKPVELPSVKDKTFGDVEGQLKDWTTDQILRSLSDPGGDSKA